MDNGEIVEFLCRLGLSEDEIIFKTNGLVTVKNLNTEESKFLIEKINGHKFFDRKMYCNGITPMTPEKGVLCMTFGTRARSLTHARLGSLGLTWEFFFLDHHYF